MVMEARRIKKVRLGVYEFTSENRYMTARGELPDAMFDRKNDIYSQTFCTELLGTWIFSFA